MSSDVMFVLFDASSVGLFHECVIFLHKNYFFFFTYKKIDLIFLHTNQKSIFLFTQNRSEFFLKEEDTFINRFM